VLQVHAYIALQFTYMKTHPSSVDGLPNEYTFSIQGALHYESSSWKLKDTHVRQLDPWGMNIGRICIYDYFVIL
jgi:hypothetical protein